MAAPSVDLHRHLLQKLISKRDVSLDDLNDILKVTARKVVEAVQAEAITFYMADGLHLEFRLVHYSKNLMSKDPDKYAELTYQLTGLKMGRDQGVVGQVVKNKEGLIITDFSKNEMFKPPSIEKTGFEVLSMMVVPIIHDEKVLGAVQVLNKHPDFNDGLFDEEDFTKLSHVAKYSSEVIHLALNESSQISEEQMCQYICELTRSERFDEEKHKVDQSLARSISIDLLKRNMIFPIQKESGTAVVLLMQNPLDLPQKDEFQAVTQLRVRKTLVATGQEIKKLLATITPEITEQPLDDGTSSMEDILAMVGDQFDESSLSGADADEPDEFTDMETETSAPIIQLANRIVEAAYRKDASDIHIEPFESVLLVRYRVDGICMIEHSLPSRLAKSLTARFKIMAELDISERRLPQDGRIVFKKYSTANFDIDLRVAVAPMNHGEKIVMRILDKQKSTLPLDALGFSQHNMDLYRKLIRQPFGMILHCGPTGSGKSMTLYSALKEIATPEINIQTAEDPIEYTLEGVNQLQVRKEIGLTFASALRSYLRQDPDIILVGEIRDQETAEIAVEASLTGHLLFSTLHTNDAAGTIARYTDMGIEPFMISSSLACVCAQRLMRRACKECKEAYSPSQSEVDLFGAAGVSFENIYRVREGGCSACGHIGYKGRIGTHEILSMSDELKDFINRRASTEEIQQCLERNGMRTLHQDTLEKVAQGFTSVEEALRIVKPPVTRA